MNTPVTILMLMAFFNTFGALIGATFCAAAQSRWYWHLLWWFIGLTNAFLLIETFAKV